MGLIERTISFVNEIKSTEEFLNLKNAKATIQKNKSLKKQIDNFKKMQFELGTQKLSEKEMTNRFQQIDNNFSDLLKIPQAEEYFKASKIFNDMMLQVFKTINENIEIALTLK